jgi:GNAT superfamily N-acetyltransferase
MIIRDALAGDVPRLVAITLDVYRLTFQPLFPQADLITDFGEARFKPRFANALETIRVAERAGEILGFCLMTQGNIDILFVARGARGSGAGAALLDDAARRGAIKLECFAANQAARRFYRRHGWIEDAAYERDFAGGMKRFVRFVAIREQTGFALPAGARKIEVEPDA